MLRAVKHQFIFVFIIIAISPCPTYAYSKESSMFRGLLTCVTNDIKKLIGRFWPELILCNCWKKSCDDDSIYKPTHTDSRLTTLIIDSLCRGQVHSNGRESCQPPGRCHTNGTVNPQALHLIAICIPERTRVGVDAGAGLARAAAIHSV
jgi:hypothetical protein